MSLNKQKGNMYSDITHTWNPLHGRCPHNCLYCSTNKLKKRYLSLNDMYTGDIRLSSRHFEDNFGSGKTIFVCSQNDLFARGVKDSYISKILEHCRIFPNNRYFFQSKSPIRMIHWLDQFPENSEFLTTIETNKSEIIRKYSGGLLVMNRAIAMSYLPKVMLTIEPIMKFDLPEMTDLIKISKPHKVYIGADSGNNNLPEPSRAEVDELIWSIQDMGIVVMIKSNLKRLK